MYARGGSIVPLMHVDDQTMNVFGKRLDNSRRDELILRVFPEPSSASEFTLFEDDGETIAYQRGAVRETTIHLLPSSQGVTIVIDGARGTYASAREARATVIEVAIGGRRVRRVVASGGEVMWSQRGGYAVIPLREAPVRSERRVEVLFEAAP
jgi:alpha-glucosidase